jgi:hypothetical protein
MLKDLTQETQDSGTKLYKYMSFCPHSLPPSLSLFFSFVIVQPTVLPTHSQYYFQRQTAYLNEGDCSFRIQVK